MIEIVAILFGILGFLLVAFILLSGPIAFIWHFLMRERLDKLAEQNAKLEGSLRKLQQDIQANKAGTPKSELITLERETPEQPAQPAQPVFRPVAPVVPFAPPPTPAAAKQVEKVVSPSVAPTATANNNRFGDSGVLPPSPSLWRRIISSPRSVREI